MGGNLPPGVSPGDPNAPWNQPDITDLLPLVCDATVDGETCGFRADTVEELDGHEHDREDFVRPEPDRPEYCSVCHPRPREHEYADSVFCSDHDAEDLRAKERAIDEQRPDERPRD